MRNFNVSVLLAGVVLLQCAIEATSFGILKALLAPPMPRVNRIRNTGAREMRKLKDPFAVLDFIGLVQRHGYPAEEHNVTTDDGYNLILHRIPNSPRSVPTKRKPIVLVMHGLVSSSDTWVLMGPGKDLAFLLADAGYDVWLGNFRGNSYSRSHIAISPEIPAYWQFSFHELGYYDLPAMIGYALEQTGQKSLIYIGHSMGTTSSYVMLSERPEYNKRVRLVVSLAPVAYWKHKLTGVLKLGVANGELIEKTLRNEGLFELVPQSSLNAKLANSLCRDSTATQAACLVAVFTFAGPDFDQFNGTLIPYISGYYPAGASLKTISHFYQTILTGEFKQYNYGYVGNFEHYKRMQPPQYNVSRITAPVALFYGKRDEISRKEDVNELERRLPNIVTSVEIAYESFNHLDFQWAKDAKQLLYDDVMSLVHTFK